MEYGLPRHLFDGADEGWNTAEQLLKENDDEALDSLLESCTMFGHTDMEIQKVLWEEEKVVRMLKTKKVEELNSFERDKDGETVGNVSF